MLTGTTPCWVATQAVSGNEVVSRGALLAALAVPAAPSVARPAAAAATAHMPGNQARDRHAHKAAPSGAKMRLPCPIKIATGGAAHFGR